MFAGDRSFCVKINSDGNIVWDKTYTGIGAIYDIKRTSDLGYIACGGAFNFYGFILKLDSLGNKQWSRIFQEGFESTLASIEVLENDQFATTGIYRSTFTSGQTLFVLFDSVGNVVVNKKLNAKNRLSSGQKIIKSDENIIISGNTLDSLNTKNVSYFQRLDKAGNILFTKIFESDKEEIFENLNILNNNKYLFNTYRIVVLNDSNIAKAFMTDSLGRISVQKTFPVENVYTRLVTSIQAENSYLIFAGMIGNDSTFANDNTLVIKTDSNLNVKTTQVTNNNFIVNGFELFQNYPNPFNPSTNIQYEIPYNGFVKIKIYDITGREILILINEFKQVGKYEINFDGKNLSSGVYFYKFESGNFTATKKMILIK
ncbi:MAG: T9SS type A sorting domain-containing protein [bacterium]|nr:T9SS type A sorting domain-containing protein [bacterium]